VQTPDFCALPSQLAAEAHLRGDASFLLAIILACQQH